MMLNSVNVSILKHDLACIGNPGPGFLMQNTIIKNGKTL